MGLKYEPTLQGHCKDLTAINPAIPVVGKIVTGVTAGLDCLMCGLNCLTSGLDCLTSGLDCLMCARFADTQWT